MMVLDIDNFELLLKVKPQLFINKKILIDNEELKILDVSTDGSYIFVEKFSGTRDWKSTNDLIEDKVVIDIIQEEFNKEAANTKPLSVNTLVSFMSTNKKLQESESIGQVQLTDPRFIEQLKVVANTFTVMQELSKSPLQRVIEQVIEQKFATMADDIVNKLIGDKATDKVANGENEIIDKLAETNDESKISDK